MKILLLEIGCPHRNLVFFKPSSFPRPSGGDVVLPSLLPVFVVLLLGRGECLGTLPDGRLWLQLLRREYPILGVKVHARN